MKKPLVVAVVRPNARLRRTRIAPKAVPPTPECECCVRLRAFVSVGILVGIGIGLLYWIDQLPDGEKALLRLAPDLKTVLHWPTLVLVTMGVFFALGMSVSCIKPLIEKLLTGKKEKAESGASLSGWPPHWPATPHGPSASYLLTALGGAAVAVGVTVAPHGPGSKFIDENRTVPVAIDVQAATGQGALPLPIAAVATGAASVPLVFDPKPLEIRQRLVLDATGKTEVVLSPDADIKQLVSNLADTARALNAAAGKTSDIGNLVRATAALSDSLTSILVWSRKEDEALAAYGKATVDVISQMNGLQVDLEFLRKAALSGVQPGFPDRPMPCRGGVNATSVAVNTDCEKALAAINALQRLRQGASATAQSTTEPTARIAAGSH